MKLLNRYIFLIVLLFSKVSFAQSFITKVSATTIGKNDVLQIEYEANDVTMEQFVLPHFNKWTVVSGPNLSSSTMKAGKVIKQQIVYSVIVKPNAVGSLMVAGATALINNKPQRSNPVAIQVKSVAHITGSQLPAQARSRSLFDPFTLEDEVPATQYLKKGEKAIDKIKNNIVIRLEVNKRSCYVGEPILATYKLCTRLRSKSKVIKQPQFNGCTVVELTGEDQDQHVEKINGVPYNVFVIRKVQLMPLEAGKLVLPQTSVENRVSFYNADKISYRDLYYEPPQVPVEEQLVTLQNKPETIEVKSLPAIPSVSNTDFSGAIGNFDAAIAIKENNITTNTTNHLLFVIEGEGNIQQVKAPVIKWPNGIEVFETTEQTDEDKSGFPAKFKKTFSFPFIANNKGTYTFPPVQFTYFDPNANRYVTKATRAFTLPVKWGKKTFFQSSNASNDTWGFKERLYILLGGGLVAVLIGLIWFNGKQKPRTQAAPPPIITQEEKREENVKHDSSEFLFAIRALQPDNDSSFFYKQLSKNLCSYINSKFGIEIEQLPLYIEQHPELAAPLQQMQELSDDCSLGMYTPVFTIEQAMQHRLEAIEVLNKLENL
ncbi:BatD family protein [Segetibacter koreensis]|uniref:BatD family protein n=1 Tax=Segetibacter koreensis TaxID=398037 RepID=UPI000362B72A|nr:BatD family protein [Segetibacter koreensis]